MIDNPDLDVTQPIPRWEDPPPSPPCFKKQRALDHLFRIDSGEESHPSVPDGWEVHDVHVDDVVPQEDGSLLVTGKVLIFPIGSKPREEMINAPLPFVADQIGRSVKFELVVV